MTFIGKMFSGKVIAFRNETGMALNIRTEEPFRFGLGKGTSDIVSLVSIKITPEMVGRQVAVFSGFECKTGDAVQTVEQKNFEKMLVSLGGIYKVVRKPSDIQEGIIEWIKS